MIAILIAVANVVVCTGALLLARSAHDRRSPSREHAEELEVRLWHLYAAQLAELGERRQRAGVYVALTSAIFAGVLGSGFSAEIIALLRANSWEEALYVAMLVYATGSLATALLALNVGLPWERRGALERAVWSIGRLVGASLGGPYAALLDDAHEHGPLSYRQFLRLARANIGTPGAEVLESVADASANDIALAIVALSEQLHQTRVWRRWAATATMIDFTVFAAGAVVAVAQLMLLDGIVIVLGVVLGLALVLAIFSSVRRPTVHAQSTSSIRPQGEAFAPKAPSTRSERSMLFAGAMLGVTGGALVALAGDLGGTFHVRDVIYGALAVIGASIARASRSGWTRTRRAIAAFSVILAALLALATVVYDFGSPPWGAPALFVVGLVVLLIAFR